MRGGLHMILGWRRAEGTVYQAVENVLGTFSQSKARKARWRVERCPDCGSNRRGEEFANGTDDTEGFVDVCLRCGWIRKRVGPSEQAAS